MKRSPLTLVVAAVLIVIFGLLLFVYQVRKSEVAVVTLFGKIVHTVKTEPGPGLRWPWPIENVYKLDQRIQNLEGKFEQIKLPDQNIILCCRSMSAIESTIPERSFPKFANGSIPEAEKAAGRIGAQRQERSGGPASRFPISFPPIEKQMKFAQIENEILQKVQKQVQDKTTGSRSNSSRSKKSACRRA